MSSRRFAAPLHLEPVPSRLLRRILLLAHAAASLLVLCLPITPLWQWLLLLLILLSYLRARPARAGRLQRLIWDAEGQWWGQLHDGRQIALSLQGDSYVAPYLVLLNLRDERRRRYSLPLLPDSLAAPTLRRLRVRLQLEGAAGPDQ